MNNNQFSHAISSGLSFGGQNWGYSFEPISQENKVDPTSNPASMPTTTLKSTSYINPTPTLPSMVFFLFSAL